MGDWTDLLPHLSEADRRQVESGLDESDARIRAVLREAAPHHYRTPVTRTTAWRAVASWPAGDRRLAALAMHREAATASTPVALNDVVRDLATGDLPWTRADLLWCLRLVGSGYDNGAHLELPAAVAARLAPAELADLLPSLGALRDDVADDYFPPAEVRRRVVRLISAAIDRASGAGLPSWLLHGGDGFGPLARATVGAGLDAAGDLLAHCASLDKPAPTAKWLRQLDAHLATTPGGPATVRRLLDLFAEHGRGVHDDTDRLLRGLLWAASRDEDDPVTALLARAVSTAAAAPRDAHGSPHAQRTAIAGVGLLAGRAGEAPVRTLARLAATVRNGAVRSRVEAALMSLGALRGWPLREVLELAVDDHGLDRGGRLRVPVGSYEATVEVVGDKARLTFARQGVALRGVPAAVREDHAGELAGLRDVVKRLGATLASERQRVEGLLSKERTWAYADWVVRFLDHPVSGAYGRRLLWETSGDGRRWSAGLPRRDPAGWVLAGRDGRPVRGDRIRLWHPVAAAVDEVLAWRGHVLSTGLTQPFKQAFREIYVLTPAEEATGLHSNRFAAHILRYRQANALMRVRGWSAGYLGSWDGGYASEATRLLGGGAWRASFDHALVDTDDAGHHEVRYCATGQVRFARRDGATWQVVPVAEVPPLVFTEAMRDVDLFVGVTSIGTDPEWADRGEGPFHAYWHRAAVAELTPSAQVRRDALARLLPRMAIADRVELSDRFLRVQGSIRAYRIHLGSGNILIEPNDAYLCIVPARTRGGRIHLPFDDDPVLPVILSKAIMLAADDAITDPTVRRQLTA